MRKRILLILSISTLSLTVVRLSGGQNVEEINRETDNKTTVSLEEIPLKEEVIIDIGHLSSISNTTISDKDNKEKNQNKEKVNKEKNKKKSKTPTKNDNSVETNVEKYTNTTVNMREGNSTNTDVIITLNPNVMITEHKISDGWSYVCLEEDTYGYIKSEYLSDKLTPISKLNRWGIDLSDDEINLLARIVFLEANLEPYKGQVAVVECVFNRMKNGYWGDSLYEVLSASGQFVSWKNRNLAKPTSKNYQAIYDVLNGKTNVLDIRYLYFSRGGHASHQGMIKIENHQFCKK